MGSRLLRRLDRIEAKTPPKPTCLMLIYDPDDEHRRIIDGEFAGVSIDEVSEHIDDHIQLTVFLPEKDPLPEIDA